MSLLTAFNALNVPSSNVGMDVSLTFPSTSSSSSEEKGKSLCAKLAFWPSGKYLVKSADLGRESVVVAVRLAPAPSPSALIAVIVNS